MSQFSGKCDVWDSFIVIKRLNDESDWSKVKIYHKDKELEINSVRDLLPYAAFLISFLSWNKEECHARISDISFVDREEKEYLTRQLEFYKREYRRCKRKKQEFIPEVVVNKYSMFNQPYMLELANRVKEHPTVATIEGLHTSYHERYRQDLRDAMLELGYTKEQADKWVFEGIKTW